MKNKPVVAIVHRPEVPGKPEKYAAEDLRVVKEMTKEAINLSIGGLDKIILPGDRVVIKPNLMFPLPPEWGATTDPRVIEALVSLIKETVKPVKVIVAENTALNMSTREAFKTTKAEEVARRAGADEVVYLEETDTVEVNIPMAKAWIKEKPRIFKTILDADVLINVPKMKTHCWACGVTLGLKNWNGILSYGETTQQQGIHREDINQKFVDLYRAVKADLTIVDGIIAMEGQGPHAGDLVEMNLITAGEDTVAVDAVTSAIMGFDPMEIGVVRIAHNEGLGVGDLSKIEIKGKKIEEVKRYFKRPVYSPVGFAPTIDVYAAGACVGCLEAIRGALDYVVKIKKPIEKAGRLIFIMGYNTYVPDRLPPGKIFIVGDCLPKETVEKHKDQAYKVYPGCAPVYAFLNIAFDILGLIPE